MVRFHADTHIESHRSKESDKLSYSPVKSHEFTTVKRNFFSGKQSFYFRTPFEYFPFLRLKPRGEKKRSAAAWNCVTTFMRTNNKTLVFSGNAAQSGTACAGENMAAFITFCAVLRILDVKRLLMQL